MDPEKNTLPSDVLKNNGFLRKIDREKGFRKAAEFLLLLDKEKASKVLHELNENEREGIVQEIISIQKIDTAEAERVLEEFGIIKNKKRQEDLSVKGGIDRAREILTAAIGHEKAEGILDKVSFRMQVNPFDFLNESDENQVTAVLGNESVPVLSLVCAHCDSRLASGIISKLPFEKQIQVVKRIGRLEKLDPAIVRQTADSIKKKLYMTSPITSQTVDGKTALLNILKQMDFGKERLIIDALSEDQPELSQEIEKQLYSMELFLKIPKKQLSMFLRELSDTLFAMMIKGESDEVREYLLECVSDRRRELILEESDIIGEVKKSRVRKEQEDVFSLLRKKIEEGEISILENPDLYV
ncbi:MAG: hypothetical protein JW904_14160 [Spirochaetales bacterium]|nr:hypothetical protein [Spirochaetales bacterium]